MLKEFFFFFIYKLFINLLSIFKCYTLSNAYEKSLGRSDPCSLVTVNYLMLIYLLSNLSTVNFSFVYNFYLSSWPNSLYCSFLFKISLNLSMLPWIPAESLTDRPFL